MIMAFCLFVYSVVESYLRCRLKKTGKTVKNQMNRLIQNPILKWIFILFMKPAEVLVSVNCRIHRFIVNLDEDLTEIPGVLGPSFEKYYFSGTSCEM